MIWKILEYLLKRVVFRVWTTQVALGRRLGGHNIPQLPDWFLMIEIRYSGHIVLLGHLQYS